MLSQHDLWSAAKRAFAEARELPVRERELYLERQCSREPELRRRVEKLLAADAAAQGFLDEPSDAHGEERAGARLGRFELLARLGEGGFGTVWMAEQREPVHRRVALKVLKPGMDARQVVSRFEQERQALAVMDHPSIARIFDGGTTPAGRPYFAMELVRGAPITEYCDDARLSTRERLELFQQVCSGVQHAHQKGVIHRDLKPSNVLVSEEDGRSVPKIIDFGIAKAIRQPLTEHTVATELHQVLGTPEYMAPEQAELSAVDVDTRADVYALGVLLYELLTGSRPLEVREILAEGLGEMLRAIREREPLRPSVRVATPGPKTAELAVRRRSSPLLLARTLRGDLDWIVLRALEKDRTRRYETAIAMAEDIERHLLSQPVLARPSSAGYRLRKYVKRHRLGVAAAASIVAAVALGLVLALLGFVSARTKAEEAQREARRAREVLALVQSMLGAADPRAQKGKDYKVRELLDDFERGLGERLQGEPEIEASIRALMGHAYRGLGLFERAAVQLEAALRLRARPPDAVDAETLSLEEALAMLAYDRGAYGTSLEAFLELEAKHRKQEDSSSHALARALDGQILPLRYLGELERAVSVAGEALGIFRALGDRRGQAGTLYKLAFVLTRLDRCAEARDRGRESVALARELQDEFGLSLALSALGEAEMRAGSLQEAEAHFEAGLELARRVFPSPHPHLAGLLQSSGRVRHELGDYEAAEAMLREAVQMDGAGAGIDGAIARMHLAATITARGGLEEAEALLRDTLAALSSIAGVESPYSGVCRIRLAQVLRRRGELVPAEAELEEAVRILRAARPGGSMDLAWALQESANLASQRGQQEAAEALAREAVELWDRLVPERNLQRAIARGILGSILGQRGDFASAEPLLREALEIQREARGERHPQLAMEWNNLGMLQRAKKDLVAAEASVREAVRLSETVLGEVHAQVAMFRANLAVILGERANRAGAEAELRRALDVLRQCLPSRHPHIGRTAANLARVLPPVEGAAEAESLLREALAIARESYGEGHAEVGVLLSDLRRNLAARGEQIAEEELLRSAVEALRSAAPEHRAELARRLLSLGSLCAASDRAEEAEPLLGEAYESGTPEIRRRAAELLGQLCSRRGDENGAKRWGELASDKRD